MLLNFAKKLRAQIKQSGETPDGPVGTLTVIELYPQLRYGDVDGIGPVTIDAEGNMVGFSPVTRCQDKHGETAWIPTELVRNIRLQPFGFVGTSAAVIASAGPASTGARIRGRARTRVTKPAA
jgi:hypothetical protein